ncbi:MAG TPA: carbohydrate ABC transporter permease, partial [Lachnospiraceae bacterium]|nr:carbohydrate ABC transporter permease [Lachnospiraceae bacterium]
MAAGTGKKEMVSAARQTKHGTAMTVFFAILAFLWISPILIVVLNSFKRKAYIFKNPFGISNVSL